MSIKTTNALRVSAMVLVLMLLDQLSKAWVMELLRDAPTHRLTVTDFFSLVTVYNYGVSFGMFAMPGTLIPYALITLALVISAILARLALKSVCVFERACYALIIGGALGNVIDRLRYGAVFDFIYLHVGDVGWPAFNVADSAIFLGVCGLLWQTFFARKGA